MKNIVAEQPQDLLVVSYNGSLDRSDHFPPITPTDIRTALREYNEHLDGDQLEEFRALYPEIASLAEPGMPRGLVLAGLALLAWLALCGGVVMVLTVVGEF